MFITNLISHQFGKGVDNSFDGSQRHVILPRSPGVTREHLKEVVKIHQDPVHVDVVYHIGQHPEHLP